MMEDSGKKLLNLMFKEGETVCVSNSKYGYHSVPFENVLGDKIKLVSPNPSIEIKEVETNSLILAAINPIKGWREDCNCIAYRNFFVEMDSGELSAQLQYIKTIGLPYSAVVFSGNKSLHFLISLDQDLPNESTWRVLAEWIVNIATLADQNIKNPSRSIRIPGAIRDTGKKQLLVEFNGKVSLKTLSEWLLQYPEAKPKAPEKKQVKSNWDKDSYKKINPKFISQLVTGTVGSRKGRNADWYAIAYDFALQGMSEDDTIESLYQFFVPEKDFREKEWKTCIRSAFKGAYSRKI